MLNEKFWLAVAFLSFLALMIKYVWPLLVKGIDAKSKKIAEEILAAKEMREKAEMLLKEAEKFYQESLSFSQKLAKDAEIEAKKLAEESKLILENELKKKTSAAIERIKLEEERMIREIKLKIISDTMEVLSQNFGLDEKNHEAI